MATFLSVIPLLPPTATSWPANLLIAYNTLSDVYQHALQAWRQEDHDLLHLEYHLSLLQGNAMHLLEAIEVDPIGSTLVQWLTNTTELVGTLYITITHYCDNICNQVDENVFIPQAVTEVHTSLCGQPKKVIDVNFLKEAMSSSQQITCMELACILGVHRNTLHCYMQHNNIE
ncbi:hypothetical protein V8B97DRAFT_2025994 [Scleroderma yunnanense]